MSSISLCGHCNEILFLQLLLAYAGPASNVRVEHASRDCFNDGGALAEVMSLFEEMAENERVVSHQEKDADVKATGTNFSSFEV